MAQSRKYLILFLILLFFSFPFKVSAQTSSFKLRVTEEVANIRQSPDIRSPIVVQVVQHTLLYGLKKEGEWYLVTWADEAGTWRTGYIHESLVTVVEGGPVVQEKQEKKEEMADIRKEKKAEAEILRTEPVQRPLPEKREPEKKAAASPGQPEKQGFRLNFAPGLEFLSLSQINDSRTGLVSLIGDLLESQQKETLSPFHLLPAGSLEIQIPLKHVFSAVFQVSGISAQRKNTIIYNTPGIQSTLFLESKVQALPLSFLLSFNPSSFLSLAAGPEIVWAEYRYLYRLHLEKNQEEWAGKARTWGSGFKGRVNLAVWLSSNLGLLLEIGGRMARLTGFEGTDTHLLPSGEKAEEKGKLYYFQVRSSPDHLYSLIFIRQKRPAEAGVEAAEEATLNFSGLSFRCGLSFRF
jgi:hypothetical protein